MALGASPFTVSDSEASTAVGASRLSAASDSEIANALADLGPALASRSGTTRTLQGPTDMPRDISEAMAELSSGLAVAEDFDEELREGLHASMGGVLIDEVEFTGSGVLTVVPGEMAAPEPDRRVVTILVRVEEGIGIDPDIFTEQVFEILNDPRGWGSIDNVSFARTSNEAESDFRLTLASPATTQELCGELPTGGYTSCGRIGNVNINAARWAHNADAFIEAGGSNEEYRTYLINHEVGHLLDHWHVPCPAPGELAPVMLQQTLHLDGCAPNGWPNPHADS